MVIWKTWTSLDICGPSSCCTAHISAPLRGQLVIISLFYRGFSPLLLPPGIEPARFLLPRPGIHPGLALPAQMLIYHVDADAQMLILTLRFYCGDQTPPGLDRSLQGTPPGSRSPPQQLEGSCPWGRCNIQYVSITNSEYHTITMKIAGHGCTKTRQVLNLIIPTSFMCYHPHDK